MSFKLCHKLSWCFVWTHFVIQKVVSTVWLCQPLLNLWYNVHHQEGLWKNVVIILVQIKSRNRPGIDHQWNATLTKECSFSTWHTWKAYLSWKLSRWKCSDWKLYFDFCLTHLKRWMDAIKSIVCKHRVSKIYRQS